MGANDASIEATGADGGVVTLPANAAGNFRWPELAAAVGKPYRAKLIDPGGERA